ncbi:MAG: thermonuclease family protein [Alphaproteobacteria bacterium]|nr:thermonuclease family protein [Alphaproteobacteria bacterium]
MTPEERNKHRLQDDWQDAYVEETIRDLVKALNRPALGMRTIAACEGHAHGFHSPYVMFRCPVNIAGLLEKRILLSMVRREGLHYRWSIRGSFNAQFDLCFVLRAYELDDIKHHGSRTDRFWTYRVQRRKIDDDLSLLAKVVNDLLEEVEAAGEPKIPDPYDEKNHSCQTAKTTVLTGFGRVFSKWIDMRAIRTFLNDRGRGKRVFTYRAWNQSCVHLKSPNTGTNRYSSRYFMLFVAIVLTLAAAVIMIFPFMASAQEETYGAATVTAVRSVYDGDTFRVNVAGWPALIGSNMPVRIAGIDAPEIKGKCPSEIALAIKARDAAARLLGEGRLIELVNIRRGKYFRIVADVRIDGVDLGEVLVSLGLARPYRSGQRHRWC